MKKQKLITGDAMNAFTTEVNLLLSNGWHVVPQTLTISVASVAKHYGAVAVRVETTTVFGIVLEEP